MKDRHLALLTAAHSVFARYGIAKTTMNDIAREAGVARQTLYNAYPSKEAVLRATVRHWSEQTFAAIEAAWRDQTDLADQLETFFQLGPLSWYDAVQASPEAADLVDGIHAIAHEELVEIARLWTEKLTAVVRRHMDRDDGTSAAQIGDFIYSASMSAKIDATDRAAIVTRLDVLKQSILALLGGR